MKMANSKVSTVTTLSSFHNTGTFKSTGFTTVGFQPVSDDNAGTFKSTRPVSNNHPLPKSVYANMFVSEGFVSSKK